MKLVGAILPEIGVNYYIKFRKLLRAANKLNVKVFELLF